VPDGQVEPVRRFGWRTGQRHRPGLQFLVSTGRHHGFESLAEQRLLLALDFVPGLLDVYFATVAAALCNPPVMSAKAPLTCS
jgi:hypothetical protein